MGEVLDFLTTAENWSGPSGIPARTASHLWLSIVAVVIASAVAIPFAMWMSHRHRGTAVAVAVVNIGRAIPSFAILALVLPVSIRFGLGLGFWPTAVAMIALAMPPLFITTFTGMRSVPPEVLDAAAGMGLSARQQLRQVEVPLALPQILTGVRIATMQVIATATLGALVAFSGLGSFIEEGRASFDRGKYLTGALLVILMALAAQSALLAVERRATPWRRGV